MGVLSGIEDFTGEEVLGSIKTRECSGRASGPTYAVGVCRKADGVYWKVGCISATWQYSMRPDPCQISG